jgi:hypothetical protein
MVVEPCERVQRISPLSSRFSVLLAPLMAERAMRIS